MLVLNPTEIQWDWSLSSAFLSWRVRCHNIVAGTGWIEGRKLMGFLAGFLAIRESFAGSSKVTIITH